MNTSSVSDWGDFDCVYFIHAMDTPHTKIGWTNNLPSRFNNFQTANASTLKLLAIHPGGRELEAAYHRDFGGFRKRGEWFVIPEEIRNLLMESLWERFAFEHCSLARLDIAKSTPRERVEFMSNVRLWQSAHDRIQQRNILLEENIRLGIVEGSCETN